MGELEGWWGSDGNDRGERIEGVGERVEYGGYKGFGIGGSVGLVEGGELRKNGGGCGKGLGEL